MKRRRKPLWVLLLMGFFAAAAWAQASDVSIQGLIGQIGGKEPTVVRPAVPGLDVVGPDSLAALTGQEDLVFIEVIVLEEDFDKDKGFGVIHEYLQNVNGAPTGGNLTGERPGEEGDVRNANLRFPIFPTNNFQNGAQIRTRTELSRGVLYSTIQALVNDGKAHILAKPSITTIDGFTAHITTSEIVPFLARRTLSTGVSSVVTEFKRVGLDLQVTPNVIYLTGQGRTDNILLQVVPEDSTITKYRMDGDFPVPIVDVRRQKTDVVVKSGETFMMSGLVREREVDVIQGIPGLIDVPGLNYLTSRTNKAKAVTELVILVTPTIVESRLIDLASNINELQNVLEERVRHLDDLQKKSTDLRGSSDAVPSGAGREE